MTPTLQQLIEEAQKERRAGREKQTRAIAEYLGCNADELWNEISPMFDWDTIEVATQAFHAGEAKGREKTVDYVHDHIKAFDAEWYSEVLEAARQGDSEKGV